MCSLNDRLGREMELKLGDDLHFACSSCGHRIEERAVLGIREVRCNYCGAVMKLTCSLAVNGMIVVNTELFKKRRWL
ncbi:MAG: hypothetical protein HW389_775 [Bacteroidetes bacterium]|nr:hypothetical protein [Bacteroidota bacterium]